MQSATENTDTIQELLSKLNGSTNPIESKNLIQTILKSTDFFFEEPNVQTECFKKIFSVLTHQLLLNFQIKLADIEQLFESFEKCLQVCSGPEIDKLINGLIKLKLTLYSKRAEKISGAGSLEIKLACYKKYIAYYEQVSADLSDAVKQSFTKPAAIENKIKELENPATQSTRVTPTSSIESTGQQITNQSPSPIQSEDSSKKNSELDLKISQVTNAVPIISPIVEKTLENGTKEPTSSAAKTQVLVQPSKESIEQPVSAIQNKKSLKKLSPIEVKALLTEVVRANIEPNPSVLRLNSLSNIDLPALKEQIAQLLPDKLKATDEIKILVDCVYIVEDCAKHIVKTEREKLKRPNPYDGDSQGQIKKQKIEQGNVQTNVAVNSLQPQAVSAGQPQPNGTYQQLVSQGIITSDTVLQPTKQKADSVAPSNGNRHPLSYSSDDVAQTVTSLKNASSQNLPPEALGNLLNGKSDDYLKKVESRLAGEVQHQKQHKQQLIDDILQQQNINAQLDGELAKLER